MGVDRAYVSGLEPGQRNRTIVTLWRLTKTLGVKLNSSAHCETGWQGFHLSRQNRPIDDLANPSIADVNGASVWP